MDINWIKQEIGGQNAGASANSSNRNDSSNTIATRIVGGGTATPGQYSRNVLNSVNNIKAVPCSNCP